jgi:hypothetical protein
LAEGKGGIYGLRGKKWREREHPDKARDQGLYYPDGKGSYQQVP